MLYTIPVDGLSLSSFLRYPNRHIHLLKVAGVGIEPTSLAYETSRLAVCPTRILTYTIFSFYLVPTLPFPLQTPYACQYPEALV